MSRKLLLLATILLIAAAGYWWFVLPGSAAYVAESETEVGNIRLTRHEKWSFRSSTVPAAPFASWASSPSCAECR